jgi:hypothetical protein
MSAGSIERNRLEATIHAIAAIDEQAARIKTQTAFSQKLVDRKSVV